MGDDRDIPDSFLWLHDRTTVQEFITFSSDAYAYKL